MTGDVLDPRPETETLVALALAGPRAGARPRPRDRQRRDPRDAARGMARGARASGTDASGPALEVAPRTPRAHGVAARAAFRLSDWTEGVAGRFDLVVCNPPYIPAAEMAGAGAGRARLGAGGGAHARADRARELSPHRGGLDACWPTGGRALFEIGAGQGAAVARSSGRRASAEDGRMPTSTAATGWSRSARGLTEFIRRDLRLSFPDADGYMVPSIQPMSVEFRSLARRADRTRALTHRGRRTGAAAAAGSASHKASIWRKPYGMRPSNKQRSRNKPGNSNNTATTTTSARSMGNIINRVFESAGPDGKVRGTPQQIIDKYQALARDAQVAATGWLPRATCSMPSTTAGCSARRSASRRRSGSRAGSRGRRPGGYAGPSSRRALAQPPQTHGLGTAGEMPQPMASGLTMIDPDDSDYLGPIETPEGRRGAAGRRRAGRAGGAGPRASTAPTMRTSSRSRRRMRRHRSR